MNCNEISGVSSMGNVGRDLSPPAPIYRPPVDVPLSEVFCTRHYRVQCGCPGEGGTRFCPMELCVKKEEITNGTYWTADIL
jgi:hypothetical protein